MTDELDEQEKENLNGDNGEHDQPEPSDFEGASNLPKTIHVSGMFKNWFLDYASYVILERAVPHIRDGLKPVQRRILHALKELDDGRFNKAANVIGHTMKYHPHGDASIGDAMVQLGQKEILIDTQGNWGNILTGDSAAAPRYIEARLSKFALEVMFNHKITTWVPSYDGRNKEPQVLPVKFPLLLAQGVEGIAVGLTSKILPHNFNELIDASIDLLRGKETEVYPDFLTGGMVDVSRYNDGARGSRVRIRARIGQYDKKTLVITEIPFGTNTSSLIDSIVAANDKGKIKIRKIEDNTAEKVEILIHLVPGVSPDTTIDALYAFTNCEMSVSPTGCVIDDQKPRFLGMKEILAYSTHNTVDLLKMELEIQKAEALEHLHFASLERIFIEKEVYLRIKKAKTDEEINSTIFAGLKPFVKQLVRQISIEDVMRLRKIPIDRISKYNSDKAEDIIQSINDDIKQINYDLDNLVQFAIDYFIRIKKKFGKGRDRRTEIRNFDVIQASLVAAANQKLYVNREEGFAGTSLKKDEFVADCSDIDDMIVFRGDGTFIVTKVSEKTFIGTDSIHISIFKKIDDRTIYNMIYQDGKIGKAMVKRFAIGGITRDKEYVLTKGTPNSRVLYFTANPNGEAETVTVHFRPKPRLKILQMDFDFSTIAIKGRASIGNTLSKNSVRKVVLKDQGYSTLGARDIWFDDTVNRLNVEQRGVYLGAFADDDRIFTITKSGFYKLYNYDLSNHFDDDILIIEKFNPKRIFTAVYFDGEMQYYFAKRFDIEVTEKKVSFIGEAEGSELHFLTKDTFPMIEIQFANKDGKERPNETVNLAEFIGVKSYKAKGKRLSNYLISKCIPLEPLPSPEDEQEELRPAILDELKQKLDAMEELDEFDELDEHDELPAAYLKDLKSSAGKGKSQPASEKKEKAQIAEDADEAKIQKKDEAPKKHKTEVSKSEKPVSNPEKAAVKQDKILQKQEIAPKKETAPVKKQEPLPKIETPSVETNPAEPVPPKTKPKGKKDDGTLQIAFDF
ncbi:MAG: DNA gyrase/topoisomerase IV subunit A [Bacteroidota bacterium]